MHYYILLTFYIKRVTEMTTNKLVAVPQDCDSSDETATKQFFNTSMLFGRQITTV